MRDSDARIDLARRIFLFCNPPDTPQELFDDGTVADRTLYFRLADLTLEVAAGAVLEYRTRQAALEAAAALDEQTDAPEFPLAEGTPVLVEAVVDLFGTRRSVVEIKTFSGDGLLLVSTAMLRPR